jgi:hypothetical protein
MYQNNITKIWDIFDGIEFYYLKTMSQVLNFTYSLIYMNHVFGSIQSDGEWNGIIGMISKNVNILIKCVFFIWSRNRNHILSLYRKLI